MRIEWYPGHMTKAKRMMLDNIKLIDLVIELVDARIPISSRNPDIDEMAKGRSRIVLLNKSDLADPVKNDEWIKYFTDKSMIAVPLDSRNRKGFGLITSAIEKACAAKRERDRKKGITGRPVRAMVVGIPNVGKSTFINTLCKSAAAKTGNKPGVTKGKQWIRLNGNVELLDTPGILWPKLGDEKTGLGLAYIGSINDEILDETELALNLMGTVRSLYPGKLFERFEADEEEAAPVMLEKIAGRRGCLKKGGIVDTQKAARIVLDEFRAGKLGRITLEMPFEAEGSTGGKA